MGEKQFKLNTPEINSYLINVNLYKTALKRYEFRSLKMHMHYLIGNKS